ncbi:KN motif and ankyrin repeat domain-containing protein 2 isoform X2 [Scleropages formosus]|uniref:KN motif and ankyrin repeat domain-containing protein 2 isoform X2 n=1 Tax=Scleropages formosus TaxID=113540 RepID=UPI0010FA8EE5|nr:KN motif and ankyrin repeat domain-containing protein 2-like isoform X2 [Scleropages formosus]
MAQVLHMDSSFPGKSAPQPPPSFGKEQESYSVETPYGYRLDLDFLKYVDDIEKGHTLKRLPVQRRPRYGSLPRGYGYAGSWWTSTESLCSNASVDSRHSSYSYCAPGYPAPHRVSGAGGAFSLSAARVEKTLLDARRRLEEEKEGQKFSNLGSMHSSVAGSTSSLASSRSFSRVPAGGHYTPMSSGLSTPISPSPAHLQHVREQMAVALRKIRELEEQVKTIPVLQVKISVLQEEKRQLSVQLKSQKFLGHTLGFGKARSRGELYIDIPEEEVGTAPAGGAGTLSPATPDGSRQDSGCEIEDTVFVGGVRQSVHQEVRSIGVGPDEEWGSCQVGVGVCEQDLGLLPEAEVLRGQVEKLEGQLRRALLELQAAQSQKESLAPPLQAEHPVRATSLSWQDHDGPGLQTVVSFTQQPLDRKQRTVGIQVYTVEKPTVVGVGTLLRAEECGSPVSLLAGPTTTSPEAQQRHMVAHGADETPRELPIAVCSRQVREVLQRSELSTSVPVSTPAVAMETMSSQLAPLSQRLREGVGASLHQQKGSEAVHLQENTSAPASPQSSMRSIMKRKAEGEPSSPTTKKNLQFIGVNGGYESTSSEESSSESSEDESDASEYHEAIERLPEVKAVPPKEEVNATSQSPDKTESTTQSTALNLSESAPIDQSPAIVSSAQQNATHPPATQPAFQWETDQSLAVAPTQQSVTQSPSVPSAPHQVTSQSPASASGPQQTVSQSSSAPMSHDPQQSTQEPENSSTPTVAPETRLELSDELMAALLAVQNALGEQNGFSQQEARSAYTTVLQEWLRVSCHKTADPSVVKSYMDNFASISPQLLEFVVNMADGNGNTALHYTVSHSNFPVVKLLLDTGLCNADKQNKAGYTAIMLTALAAFHSESDLQTVLQLLRTGDVNAKASQAGQTALMLAVSHGRGDMVRALLSCGAQVNIRDDDGSTALMCACEHGHVDIVRQLLAVPGCDATLADNDGSTALSIALEASQNDIAVLLYAHLNFAKPPSPVSPKASHIASVSDPK